MGVESDAQAKPEHDRGKRSFPADWISPALAGAFVVGSHCWDMFQVLYRNVLL